MEIVYSIGAGYSTGDIFQSEDAIYVLVLIGKTEFVG